MNSKFLKKLALSCLVLGAVNYGNIGNTMEEEVIVKGENPVNENYITVKHEVEKDGKQLKHYIGKIGGEQFDIDATKQIELKKVEKEIKLFNQSYDDYRMVRAVNEKRSTLQSWLNRAIKNKVSNIMDAYGVFLEYYNEKTGKIYSLEDIVRDTVNNCVKTKNCKVGEKYLKEMIDYYTSNFQKNQSVVKNLDFSRLQAPLDFAQRKEGEPKSVITISDFFQLFGYLVKHISADLKDLSKYEIDSSKKADEIMQHEFYEPKSVITQQEMPYRFRKDVLGNIKEGEKINYDDCSRLVQYIIKYMPDEDFRSRYGGDFSNVIVNDDIKKFRYVLDALKRFAAVLKQNKSSGFVDDLKKLIASKVNNSIENYIKKKSTYMNAMKELDDYHKEYEKNKDYYSNVTEESAFISNIKKYDMKDLNFNNINVFNIDEEFSNEEIEDEKQNDKKTKDDPLDDLEGDIFYKDDIKEKKEVVEVKKDSADDSVEEHNDSDNELDNNDNGTEENTIKGPKKENNIKEKKEVVEVKKDSADDSVEESNDSDNELDNNDNGTEENNIKEPKKENNIKEPTKKENNIKETEKENNIKEPKNDDDDDDDVFDLIDKTTFIK